MVLTKKNNCAILKPKPPPVNSLYNLAQLYGVPVETFLELVVTYHINMDFALKE